MLRTAATPPLPSAMLPEWSSAIRASAGGAVGVFPGGEVAVDQFDPIAVRVDDEADAGDLGPAGG
jgi:hypothetical protein